MSDLSTITPTQRAELQGAVNGEGLIANALGGNLGAKVDGLLQGTNSLVSIRDQVTSSVATNEQIRDQIVASVAITANNIQTNIATPTVPPVGVANGFQYWAAISEGVQLYTNNNGTGVAVNPVIIQYGKLTVDALSFSLDKAQNLLSVTNINPIFIDDGYIGGTFDANGYPINAILKNGDEVSNLANLVSTNSNYLNILTSQATGLAMFGASSIFIDDGYSCGFFDANGYPIEAVTLTGSTVTMSAIQLTYQPIFLDDGYNLVFIDNAGNVIYGVASSSSPLSYDNFLTIIDTDNSLRLVNDSINIKIASALGIILEAPKIVSTTLKWVDKQNNLYERRQFSLKPWSQGNYNKLIFVPTYGQSLSVGTSSGALYTTSPIAVSRALMFNGGTRPLTGPTWDHYGSNGADDLRSVTDDSLLSLVDLKESLVGSTGETQLSGIAYWLNKVGVTETTSAFLFETFGIGGCWIDLLKKGTKPYANLIRSIERAKAIADYLGVALEIPCVVFDQGESDYSNGYSGFKTALLALQANLSSDINVIMGDAILRPLLCWQPSSWTAAPFNLTTVNSTRAIIDAAISNPTQIKLIGPQYFDSYFAADGIHKSSRGYRRYGEYAGRAVAKLRASLATGALYATTATVIGVNLTVNFSANCQIDTNVVSDPGQYGIRLVNTSTNAVIALSSISISGSTLTATAASAPTGSNWVIGIGDIGVAGNAAGPTTGPRVCIRDNSSDINADGSAMYNWACHQQISPVIS